MLRSPAATGVFSVPLKARHQHLCASAAEVTTEVPGTAALDQVEQLLFRCLDNHGQLVAAESKLKLLGEPAQQGERQQLAAPGTGEYYWADLIGLHVVNREGEPLGRVAGLIDTGANDVLRVEGLVQRLIPFVEGVYIDEINWEAAEIRVDWHVDD